MLKPFAPRCNRKILFVFWQQVSILVAAGALFAQTDSVWVKSSGRCISTEVSPEEGWRRAHHDAEANAIRDALGTRVSEETFGLTSEAVSGGTSSGVFSTFSKLNTTTTAGRVIREEVLSRKLGTENEIPSYTVEINALVAKDRGQPDPNFLAELHLDRDTYYDRGSISRNDAVGFSITANQDCYVYIFDVMANDSVMLVIPNAYFTDNFYVAEDGTQGFDAKISKLPFALKVGLPPGKQITTEMLYMVALKNRVDFTSSTMSAGSIGIIPSYKSAILDLQKWLVRIPQDQRTSSSAPFTIKRLR